MEGELFVCIFCFFEVGIRQGLVKKIDIFVIILIEKEFNLGNYKILEGEKNSKNYR